jgi:hypothetical protein
MPDSRPLIPIFTTRGDLGAYLCYPFLHNPQGEWIGWVAPDRNVYSVYGHYVGWLSEDPRILRRRSDSFDKPTQPPPARPTPIKLPARIPLPKMLPELPYGIMDVLEELAELLPASDFGEKRQDLD